MDTLKQSIILFDLDGTLTDSEEGIIRSTQYMQEKMAAGNAMANMALFDAAGNANSALLHTKTM